MERVNAKMIPVETIPGMGGGLKECKGGVNPCMIYLIHFKNFCVTVVPHPAK
jgi:hypothetical protein